MNESIEPAVNVPVTKENLCKRENVYLLISTVVLGILFNILFYKKPLGISYPVFIAALYVVFIENLRSRLDYRSGFGWALTLPIIMLSLTYLIFSNTGLAVLDFLAIPVLAVLQTTILSRSGRNKWYTVGIIADILYGFIYRPLAHIAKPFAITAQFVLSRKGIKQHGNIIKVLIGVLVSVPLIAVIISLLSSADKVFESFMGKIPNFFKSISLGSYLAQIIIAVIIAVLFFSYFWSMFHRNANLPDGSSLGIKPEWKKLDPVVTVTVFTIVNAIYVFFTFIQFSYLFGSLSIGLPKGFTYAEYARRGFFELVLVTLVNFGLLLVFLYFTNTGNKVVDRVKQVLFSLLVVNTLVLLVSAYFRMSLYEEAYGYTYLRLLTHAFMIFLLVIFLITLYRIWREKMYLMKPYIITAIAAFVIINYLNIDVIIARNNIDRYHEKGKIDISYLASLSYDAVPELVRLLDDKDENMAKGVENVLYNKKQDLKKHEPWQAFNLSKYKAKKVLAEYDLHYNPGVVNKTEIYGEGRE